LNSRTTRLAPSPTGTLHLGHARTFLFTWALARSLGWRIVLRLEDLDHTRVRPGAHEETLELLRWLQIDWDGPIRVQSADLEPYRSAMHDLAAQSRIYRCERTRSDVARIVGAPHADERVDAHPSSLRPSDPAAWTFHDEAANYRLRVDEGIITIDDHVAGSRSFEPFAETGDFIVWSKLGVPAYQLAVTVDDARTEITDVVRGDDLLSSAARQEIIYRHLGADPPRWWHLPLITDPSGRRLAKRAGDQRLTVYRDAGVSGAAVIGLMAYWCGVIDRRQPLSGEEVVARFDAARLPAHPVALTDQDIAWLMENR